MYTFPFIYTLTLSLNPTNGDLFMFVFYRIKATFYIFPLDVSDSLSIFNMFLLIRKKERLMNMSIKIIIYFFFLICVKLCYNSTRGGFLYFSNQPLQKGAGGGEGTALILLQAQPRKATMKIYEGFF